MDLHNFIRQQNIRDYDFDIVDIDNDVLEIEHIGNSKHDEKDGIRVKEESEAGT